MMRELEKQIFEFTPCMGSSGKAPEGTLLTIRALGGYRGLLGKYNGHAKKK